MLNLNHKKLDVWKRGMELVKKIYVVTKNFPKDEIYGISNQLRRAAVSIVSNIAEGSARKSVVERIRFYEIARSSLVEVDTQIEICKDLNYITIDQYTVFGENIVHIFAMLSKLISRQN